MTDDQIKHMVDRFLNWRLPKNFAPDNGISFEPQAEAMVRHMVEGLSAQAQGGGEAGSEATGDILGRLGDIFNDARPAFTNLATCQRQLDQDGCEVGVSRQAVDETVDAILRAADTILTALSTAHQPLPAQAQAWRPTAAEVAQLERLGQAAAMLQQNSEGCAANHYPGDYDGQNPGWLQDTDRDVRKGREVLEKLLALRPTSAVGGECD